MELAKGSLLVCRYLVLDWVVILDVSSFDVALSIVQSMGVQSFSGLC